MCSARAALSSAGWLAAPVVPGIEANVAAVVPAVSALFAMCPLVHCARHCTTHLAASGRDWNLAQLGAFQCRLRARVLQAQAG